MTSTEMPPGALKGVGALYICYFGAREPLVQTQVLPYLKELAADGASVTLLTFERVQPRNWPENDSAQWLDRVASAGVRWIHRTYHSRPSLPATIFDICVGAATAAVEARRHGLQVIHARAHTAAAMAALASRFASARFLFDIRGFNPEEYVDMGVWRQEGLNFRLMKAAERRMLRAADAFVVLTDRAREILWPAAQPGLSSLGKPLEVIPCCVDLERFQAALTTPKEQVRAELGLTGKRVLTYVGALGGFYLTAETAALMAAACRRDPRVFCLVLTQSDPTIISAPLRALGVPDSSVLIRKVPPSEVPRYLRATDLAISLIKPSYSKQASSPTKIAEYLAAGIPVLLNRGVGDLDRVVDEDQVGVTLDQFNDAAYSDALTAADCILDDPDVSNRCQSSARRRFDLHLVGGVRYRRLYIRMRKAYSI